MTKIIECPVCKARDVQVLTSEFINGGCCILATCKNTVCSSTWYQELEQARGRNATQSEHIVIGSTPDGRYILGPGQTYEIDIQAHVGTLRLIGIGGYGEYAACEVSV